MAKVSDVRGKPGDIVMPRGGQPIAVWRDISVRGEQGLDRSRIAGVIMPTSVGMIIATHMTAWTYVLWSVPCIIGWVQDGELRRLA
jgi:hypothetical protein